MLFSYVLIALSLVAVHSLGVRQLGARAALCRGRYCTNAASCLSLSARMSSTRLQMGILDDIKKAVGMADPVEALGLENDRKVKEYLEVADKINALEDAYESLTNEQLRAKTDEFRKRLASGASLDSVLVEAFAAMREASWRVLQLRHYDVQLVGGMALNDGRLAEMATGEGKTLVAILPSYLNALGGESSLVVTTNDYLARRDGETMGQVFRFMGLTVGIVQNYQKEGERKSAYNCDVTYVPNQELGFDFLRDNLAMDAANIVQQRPFNFCIVDECDSILIDEARTPLIISRKGVAPVDKYLTAAEIAKNLVSGVHYEVNLKDQKVELTSAGFKFAEQIVGKSLFDLVDPWAFYVVNALKARELYNKDKEYIVKDGAVAIIDSFSGRVLDGRRFTDGLQQSIEAKEALKVSSETQVVAKVTYQNLFRLFPKLSGMTGTALTEASEFNDVYKLNALPIPTALPVARRDNQDAVFRTKEGKMKALLRNVLGTHEKGRPVLIGTTSIDASEEMVLALKGVGVNAQVLNAKPENVERESEIVSQAGRLGAVTVATNMAGRGTDIILGGSAAGTARVLAKHMMLVQLKLTSMPPAATAAPIAVEGAEEETDPDVLALPSTASLAEHLRLWMPQPLSAKTELALKRSAVSCSDLVGAGAGLLQVEDVVAQAADSAPTDRVEIKLLRAALQAMTREFDETIKLDREKVKRLGGLYVVGTSRHESRRIDNQLRGRAGRQGDPGGTRFFLSLEDDIFRVFGADKMSALLENFRVAEDMPIESDLVVQALDKVQVQVEDYNKASRSQVFKLDEVTSSQRAALYSQRRAFLTGGEDGMIDTFSKYCAATMSEIHEAALVKGGSRRAVIGDPVDADKLVAKALQFFPILELKATDVSSASPDKVQALLRTRLDAAVAKKRSEIDALSSWAFPAFFRYISLVQVDEVWCKHLSRLDLLKEEMVLQSFTAEKDVMETYRERANKLYSSLMDDVRRNTVYSIFVYSAKKGN